MPSILQKPIIASNYNKGRFNVSEQPIKPDVIVIHVAATTLQGCFNTFNNPSEQKSTHYCVGELGEVWQFVEDINTAWHVGFIKTPTAKLVKARLGKYPNPNSYCLGIENSGEYFGDVTPNDFSDLQYESNGWLVAQLARKWNIPLDRDHIIGHKEIRSDKTCPGTKVSIQRIIDIAKNTPADKVEELKQDIISVLNEY